MTSLMQSLVPTEAVEFKLFTSGSAQTVRTDGANE